MGGGKGGTTTQTVKIPPEVLARYNAVNARAEEVAAQPFQQYTGQFVAPLTEQQRQGMQGISAAAGAAQPYYQAAAGLTAAGARGVGPLTQAQIRQYESPYIESVVDPTRRALEQQQAQERSMLASQAIRAGAFGGDRAGLERANLARQQALGMAQAISPLYQQGYGQALQTAVGQQQVQASDLQRQLAAGQQFGGLGTGAQAAALQGAQAQIGAGTLEQQTQQADLTARYQQFLQERGYPFQVAQFLANIAMGTGALSGSTTTTTQPTSFFSDERMKENIKPIGETFDGQTIYKYNYKGEPGTQIGLIAQEVEQRKPEAVGMAGGMKTVDYDRATEEAGGIGKALASMGGAVREPGAYSRGGYAPGGMVDPNDLQAILAAQRQSFGPFGQGGPYGQGADGAPYGGAGGIVPKANLPVAKLVTAGAPPRQQEGGLQQGYQAMKQITDLGEQAEKFGKFGKRLAIGTPEVKDSAGKVIEEATTGAFGSAGDIDKEGFFGKLGSFFGGKAYGGSIRPAYAAGGAGSINPYDQSDKLEYFPTDVLEEGEDQKRELLKPGSAPGGGGGGGGLGSALGTAASVISAGKTVASAVPAILGFFSDERLKHNIEPIGKTYDGQNIYRYDFGDGRTTMGLMAQEVAERKPEAVGRGPGGFMTLDYDRATEEAVPHRGGVMPREGLQAGGTPEEDPTFALLREKEGFRERPYYDVNAYRVGYGSDTITTPEGKVVPVTKDVAVTREDAERDLARRVGEYQGQIRNVLGEERFSALSPQARAALTSVTYNYGRLPESVARAAAEGDPAKIAAAVNALGTHNEGINARRRAAEAAMIDPTGSYAAMRAQAAGVKPSDMFGGPPKSFQTGKPFESWTDFATSKQFVVPLLSGLGAMASSPSRYLGSAILQGLGRGAESYANLEQQQAGIEKTKAETGLTGAQMQQVFANIPRTAMIVDELGRTVGVRVYINGRMTIISPKQYYDALRSGRGYDLAPIEGTGGPGAPGVTGAAGGAGGPGTPGGVSPAGATTAEPAPAEGAAAPGGVAPPIYRVLPNDIRKLAEERGIQVQETGYKNLERSPEANPFDGQSVVSQEMQKSLSQRNMLAKNLAEIGRKQEAGLIEPGKFSAEIGVPIASWLKGFLRNAGVDTEGLNTLQDLGKVEVADKIRRQLALGMASQAGERAARVFEELMAAVPGQVNDPEAAAQLVADIYYISQREIDMDRFYRQVRSEAERRTGINQNESRFIGQGLPDEFNKRMSLRYEDEKKALRSMYLDKISVKDPATGKMTQTFVLPYILSNQTTMPRNIRAEIERRYGPDIFRYFSGN